MDFLAKTNPIETIPEHTNYLLYNLKKLKKIYPSLNINWEVLYYACLYHDLGKMNPKFQEKLRTFRKIKGEIPHNILSLAFINIQYLEEQGITEEEIKLIFQAVAYHHNRSTDFTSVQIEHEIQLMVKALEKFEYEPLNRIKFLDNCIDEDYFILGNRIYESHPSFFNYIMLKGLLNRLDYASSAHIDVEIENDFLENDMNQLLEKWKREQKTDNWNELQQFMINNKNENIIAIAQTGMGKTEAGLLWIGNQKGFFTLPLKTAINEIYKRIINEIVEKPEQIGLLHSDTFSRYLEREDDIEDIQEYYNKTKQLSLPLTVCTLDQLFDFVYLYMDFEPKLATLSYSKIVIDEIQMYSPNLLAYLIYGLHYITKVGGKFAILTATFPPFIEDELKKRGIDVKKAPEPFIKKEFERHSVKLIKEQLNIEEVKKQFLNNRILIVCNTVKKAQSIYNELCDSQINSKYIHLLHSKFIKKDRNQKEQDIMKLGRSKNEESGIWIGTQIVEASLDIDFDLLFSELSDINGLFQRFGRCYRNREYKGSEYNCYVYIGDNYPCSGISNSENSVIDIAIYEKSKEVLLNNAIDGVLLENEKISLINQVYNSEVIKETKYYQVFQDTLEYLKNINPYETTKSEVKERFRNILSVNIIPRPVYEENQSKIEELKTIINKKVEEKEDYQKTRKERYKAMDQLKNFTCSISYNEARSYISKNDVIMLGKYEEIFILECEYSYEKGIVLKKELRKELKEQQVFDALFI